MDLEHGSHHVMVPGRSYDTCQDDISHLSDPTGLESTPSPRHPHRGRLSSFLSPTSGRRPVTKKRWVVHLLKRAVQRQMPHESELHQHQQRDLEETEEQRNYMPVHVGLERTLRDAPPSAINLPPESTSTTKQQHSLLMPLSPEDHHPESDPLLIFEHSPRTSDENAVLLPVKPTKQQNYHTLPTQLSAATTAEESNYTTCSRAETTTTSSHLGVPSRWHLGMTIFMYTLLVLVCTLDLLAPSAAAASAVVSMVLGIGSATVVMYLVWVKIILARHREGATSTSDKSPLRQPARSSSTSSR